MRSLPAARWQRLRQPQHRGLRRRRRPVVHRPERRGRQAGRQDRRGHACTMRRAAAGRTASAPRRRARSGGVRWPARSLPASTAGRASRSSSSRRRRTRARAASGATAVAASGSASGTAATCRCTTRRPRPPRRPGGPGSCRATRRAATRCTSTNATWSGPATSAATRCSRFDPASERFERFGFPREDTDIRQILGRPGEVWLPESGTEHISVIRSLMTRAGRPVDSRPKTNGRPWAPMSIA